MSLYCDFPENQGMKVNRELDVLCIVDGQFVIGEAKQKADQITNAEIEELAKAAIDLNANVAVLAVLFDDSRCLDVKVARLRDLLPTGIEARGIMSDWNVGHSYYL
jgi:hypothetical protein